MVMNLNKTTEKETKVTPGQISLLGMASTMGLHMVSGPVVGGGLGWLVDYWLGSWPVGAFIGLFLGLAAGFHNVWQDAHYLEKVNAEQDAVRKRQEIGDQENSIHVNMLDESSAVDDKKKYQHQRFSSDDMKTASIISGILCADDDIQEEGNTMLNVRSQNIDRGSL
jgi:F0F1-type ATP synthase assembly protein I